MYVIDVDTVISNDGAQARDVIPVRVYTTPTALINGQWRDVIPVDGVSTWTVQDGQGKFHSALPIKVYDADTVLINGVRRNVMPVRVVSGSIGFFVGAQVAFDFTKSKYRVGTWRRNLCTNFNSNPQALTNVTKAGDAASTLTLVDDTAALAAIGLTGNVFKLDNSAGVATANVQFAGAANVIPETMSAYVRGGSGNIGLNLASSLTAFAASATYQRRVSAAKTPDGAGRFMIVQADPGQVVYVILNQLEDGTAPTAPIVVAGAAVTVYDDPNPGAYSSAFAFPGLTVARSSTGYAVDSTGKLKLFAANVARIVDLGLLIEEARTNKCTNTNVNPQNLNGLSGNTGIVSVVDDSAALAAIGLTGNAYKADNSAGGTSAFITIGGATGNTNPHTMSIYVRKPSGSNTTSWGFNGNGAVIFPTASYTRAVVTQVPADAVRQAELVVRAGDIVYFVLNQLEEGAFATSPIAVAGAAATRAADNIVQKSLAPSLGVTLLAKVLTLQVVQTAQREPADLSSGDGTNRVSILLGSGGTALYRVTVGGTTTNPGDAGTPYAANTVTKSALAVSAGAAKGAAAGVLTTVSAPASVPPFSQLNVGVGEIGAGQEINGYVQAVVMYPTAFSDAQLQALTA